MTSNNNNLQQKLEGFLLTRPVILQFFKFAAIGFLTAGLDFLVLNFLSELSGIDSGWQLGALNIISFIAAVIHNYLWQRHWTFAEGRDIGLWRNFVRCIAVGGIGIVTLAMVIFAGRLNANWLVYSALIILFLLLLWALWSSFQLLSSQSAGKVPVQFTVFLVVSIIGLLINTVIVSLVSQYLVDYGVASDLSKNSAKIAANAVALVWNFTAYKLIVFKK